MAPRQAARDVDGGIRKSQNLSADKDVNLIVELPFPTSSNPHTIRVKASVCGLGMILHAA